MGGLGGFLETVHHTAGRGRYAQSMTEEQTRFVPFSVRNGLREPFGVTSGLPDYLKKPVTDLMNALLQTPRNCNDFCDRVILTLRIDTSNYGHGFAALDTMIRRDDSICIDVLDFLLRLDYGFAKNIEGLLWEVNHEYRVDFHNKRLVKRVDDAEWAVYEQACSAGDRAAQLIQKAWLAVFGRPDDLDAAAGWSYATKAVEEVLKPIVAPNDPSATFGKMTAALHDGPTKWKCDLPGDSKLGMDGLGQFRAALAIVGYAPGRHGGDDREGPTHVTARAVVLQAAVILAWIADGVLARV